MCEALEHVTTLSDAARRMGMSEWWLRYARDFGHIRAEKRGGTWLVDMRDVRRYHENGPESKRNTALKG